MQDVLRFIGSAFVLLGVLFWSWDTYKQIAWFICNEQRWCLQDPLQDLHC